MGTPTSPTSPNVHKEALDVLVKKFTEDCAEIGSHIYLIAASYQNASGENFYRTHIEGETDEVLGALLALISMLTPRDFQLLEIEMKSHQGFASLRNYNVQQQSKQVH